MEQDIANPEKISVRSNPFYDAPEAKKKLTLVGLIMSVALATAFLAVTSTLLPVAAREIGGTDIYAFNTALASVGALILMPLWGYIAARKPALKRVIFCVSMLVGSFAMLIFATAQNMLIIVFIGPCFGCFNAAIFVLSYTMIRDMYPPKQAGVYLGINGGSMAAASIASPLIAGIVIQACGWRVACGMFIPFIVLGLVLVYFGVNIKPEEVDYLASKGGKFDPISAVCLLVTLASLVTLLSFGPSYIPFGSIGSNLLIVVTVVFGVLTVLAERAKGDDAIVPISAVLDHDTRNFFLTSVFTNFSNLAPYFFLPTYALYAMNCSALEASLTISAFTLLSVVLSPLFSRKIGERGNARTVLVAGTITRIVVMLLFIILMAPDMNIWLLFAICLLGGIPTASYGSGLQSGPQIQLKPELRVQGHSLIQMGQPIGCSIGLAVYTIIMASFGVAQGMHIAMILSAIAAGIALIFAMMLSKAKAANE